MKIITSLPEMTCWSHEIHRKNQTVALVPTMGNLHNGHLSCVRSARQAADLVVVSIYVNPLQFGPQEDFNSYPRTLEDDLQKLKKESVAVVFCPETFEIYPNGFQTTVSVKGLSQYLCGKYRPGHFNGVATVVLKLFHAVMPDVALFGDKDFQQRRVIEQMVFDLNLPIRIQGVPTVREVDGLAMSSRNIYLTPDERERAPILYQALKMAQALVKAGERDAKTIRCKVYETIDKKRSIHIDYVEVCNSDTLEGVLVIDKGPVVLAVAVKFGKTRLIDNIILK